MNLRQEARGRPCQIRVPSVCIDSAPEHPSTVGCHVRVRGAGGMALKPIDILIADGCSACHDYVDGRSHRNVDHEHRRLMLLEGLVGTLLERSRSGYELKKGKAK